MKTMVYFSGLEANDVGLGLIEDLKKIHPGISNHERSYISGSLPERDPLVDLLRVRLQQAGLAPSSGHHPIEHFDRRRFYRWGMVREYDSDDLDRADLLQMIISHTAQLFAFGRTPLGYEALSYDDLHRQPTMKIAHHSGAYFVLQSVKEVFEKSPLRRVAFKPTVLKRTVYSSDPSIPWSEVNAEPWWELTSDLYMPPLAVSTELVYHFDYKPMSELEREGHRWGDGVVPVEGLFARPELHYRRKDLVRHMPAEWDAARTFEPFGHRDWDCHPLICSQRFYRFCRDQGIEAEWIPVRIED